MINDIQKLISDIEAEKEKAIEEKVWYKKHSDEITFQAMSECYEIAFSWIVGRLTQILLEHQPNNDIQPQLQQTDVSGWRAFQAGQMPEADQEIWIVWPSGNYPPEFRQLTEDDLKQDWSDMRWMPVPAYR